MQQQLFRKVALERLSSPEQLDQLMQVTTPRGWVSLLAIGALLVCAIVWGFVGYIPTKVSGQGMLMRTGGVFEVVATSAGEVRDVYFEPGDVVQKGRIVERVAQPQILHQIRESSALLEELRAGRDQVFRLGSEEEQLERKAMVQERAVLGTAVSDARERLTWLEEKRQNEEQLLDEGLITRQQLLATRQELSATRQLMQRSHNQLQEIDIRELQLRGGRERELRSLDDNIRQTERLLEAHTDDLDESSKIVSLYTGRVIETAVDVGDIVQSGTPLIRIELMGRDIKTMEAVMYFPAAEGKRVQQGMTAQVAPVIVEQSEFGYLLGLVTYVADYPSTREGMMRTLQNETLVRELSQGGAPIEVRADLIPDPRTPSGYKWSSSRGPDVRLQTGTACFSMVTVARQKPIGLVIPLLRKHVLGVGEAGPG